MGLLDKIFGNKSTDIAKFITKGAVAIDIRTSSEFQSGNINGSKNYPLQSLAANIDQIKKINKPLILCCASGIRSGRAKSILQKHGLECMNGGSWTQVDKAFKA